MGKSNNTRLHLHLENCYQDTRIEPIDETHRIEVYTLRGEQHTRLYVPQFFRRGQWFNYTLPSGAFATWVLDNAKRLIEGYHGQIGVIEKVLEQDR